MKRLVVGLDGSPHQDKVLEAALSTANGDSRLLLVRAVTLPIEVPHRVLAVSPNEVGPILEKSAQEDMQRMAERVPAARLEGVQVEMGTPWRTLVEAAKRIRADLIVIGSHGYGGLDRLLGTTAAKVVDHSPCSVLVVR
jgi:nucleotide-binding universal stress UspA family protein